MVDYSDFSLCVVEEKAAAGESDFMFELARRLRLGIGVTPDSVLSFKWYLRSAEKGYVRGMFMAGVCYRDGYGVSSNKDEASRWFMLATSKRHPVAMYNYRNYLAKRGGARNIEKSTQLLQIAAEMNHTSSLNWLAIFYWRGLESRGIYQDREQAIKLARRGALLGSKGIQHNLGNFLYAIGEIDEAYIWYTISGLEDARNMCAVIEKKLSGISGDLKHRIACKRKLIQQNVLENSDLWWLNDNEFTEHVIARQ